MYLLLPAMPSAVSFFTELLFRLPGRHRQEFLAVSGKGHAQLRTWPLFNAGNYLLSHTLSRAVPSAQRGLTSVFGMGTGVSPAVRSPTTCCRAPLVRDAFSCGKTQRTYRQEREFDVSQLNRLGNYRDAAGRFAGRARAR